MRLIARLFVIISSFLPFLKASGQDTIVLTNGKRINANVLEIKGSAISYRIDSKEKKINPFRVFSVIKADGTEQVVFKPDTIDEADFTVDQLRIFIKGEHDARVGYHNTLNKAAAFLVGAGSSFFSIYGLVGPALYSSIVGSVSPDINKQRNTNPAMMNNPDYQEGYLTVSRSKKIKNSYLAGMIGFVAGFTTQSIIGNNSKK